MVVKTSSRVTCALHRGQQVRSDNQVRRVRIHPRLGRIPSVQSGTIKCERWRFRVLTQTQFSDAT